MSHCSGRCCLSVWDLGPRVSPQWSLALACDLRWAEGSIRLNLGKLWWFVLVSDHVLGPCPTHCPDMPVDDSVEQPQFRFELLTPIGELVIIPGNQHSSPQPSCLGFGMQTRRLPVGLPSQTLHGHSDGCGMASVNRVLQQVDMYGSTPSRVMSVA